MVLCKDIVPTKIVAIKVTPNTRAVPVAPVRLGSRFTFSPASLKVAEREAKGRVRAAVNAGRKLRQASRAAKKINRHPPRAQLSAMVIA